MSKLKNSLLLAFALVCGSANALQFTLSTNEPICINVEPKSVTEGITVTYTVTGMNEDMVRFTARQNGKQLYTISNTRDHQVTIDNRGNGNVELCWDKLDRKAKKVTFLIQQKERKVEAKATVDTVEGLQKRVEDL